LEPPEVETIFFQIDSPEIRTQHPNHRHPIPNPIIHPINPIIHPIPNPIITPHPIITIQCHLQRSKIEIIILAEVAHPPEDRFMLTFENHHRLITTQVSIFTMPVSHSISSPRHLFATNPTTSRPRHPQTPRWLT
jgi:hypothetical protein